MNVFGIEENNSIMYTWGGDEDEGRLEIVWLDTSGHVGVFFTREPRGQNGPRIGINWPAVPPVSIEGVKKFRALLAEAVRIGEIIAYHYVSPKT